MDTIQTNAYVNEDEVRAVYYMLEQAFHAKDWSQVDFALNELFEVAGEPGA